MKFSIKIIGSKELVDKFSKLVKDLDAILQDALAEAGGVVFNRLKSNTPVDTGNLRDSISVENKGLKTLIGPDLDKANYAPFVEFGYHHYISGNFIQGQHYIEKTTIESRSVVKLILLNKIHQRLLKL